MHTIVNLKNATVRIQMSKIVYAKLLAYFNCTQRGQLNIMSGEVYEQGCGWYLAILNEKFEAAEAANRFIAAITIAFKHGDVIQASKKKMAEVVKNIREAQVKAKRRVIQVDQVFHHGRQYSVARTRVVSAFWNRDSALDEYIREASNRMQLATPANLSNLTAHFNG